MELTLCTGIDIPFISTHSWAATSAVGCGQPLEEYQSQYASLIVFYIIIILYVRTCLHSS